jgi:hypothetical protein
MLSGYQSRLAALRTKADARPDLDLSAPLAAIQADIDSLSSSIQQARATLALYNSHHATLTKAIEAYNQALAQETQLNTELTSANQALTSATSKLASADSSLATLTKTLATATSNLTTAQQKADAASAKLATAKSNRKTALDAVASAQAIVDNLGTNNQATAADLRLAQTQLASAKQVYATALQTYTQLANQLQDAITAKSLAQSNYDTYLIPDPTYQAPTYQQAHTRLVPHTRDVVTTTQVPHTTYTTTGGITAEVFNRRGYNNAPPLPTSTETPVFTTNVPNIDFQWGGGQVLNSGYSEDVIVRFTGNLVFPTDGYYQFYAPADDGTKLSIGDTLLINDWFDKGGGGSISPSIFIQGGVLYPFTLYYYENGGGAAVSFLYNNVTTGTGYQVVPAAYLGTQTQAVTTYTTETTTTTETYYTEEIYYTTELVTAVEQTMTVDIGEGGSATFTAPANSTFISSSLRYESYNDPTCGANVTPTGLGSSTITLYADNGVFGDPCGGQVKHLVGTLTYLASPSAPLIHDPSLLPALESASLTVNTLSSQVAQAQADLDSAQTSVQSSQAVLDAVQASLDGIIIDSASATQALANAQAQLDTATTQLDEATVASTSAETDLTTSTQTLSDAQSSYDQALSAQATAAQELATAQSTLDSTTAQLASAKAATIVALDRKTTVETAANSAQSEYSSALSAASQAKPDFSPIETELAKPEPTPEETGSKEIPAELSAENLMEVNLDAVDPTELTPAQAEQLKEAALETFETATQGSPEYEQALDALYLAAEQDDIVLSPELAAIPGLAAATELVNFLGNAGADMSPQVREQSKKIVVTAVVAAGVAVQAAAGAATSAATSSASGSSSGSGSSRRKQ